VDLRNPKLESRETVSASKAIYNARTNSFAREIRRGPYSFFVAINITDSALQQKIVLH
jgi:hypothetical protein